MTQHRSLTIAVALGLTLAACSSTPQIQRFAPPSFSNEPVLSFNVAKVEVVSEYRAPADHPNIENEMPVSPELALRQWAKDRLRAAGGNGTVRLVIHNASATETPVAHDQGFSSNFKKQIVAKVDMAVDATVQILDERQYVVAEVAQHNEIAQTELEGKTLNERDQLLYDAVVEMTRGFDKQIEPSIRSTLGKSLGS